MLFLSLFCSLCGKDWRVGSEGPCLRAAHDTDSQCSLLDPDLLVLGGTISLAVLEKLELIFNSFIWGSRPLGKKCHWARWSRVCLPVSEGGLGFRRLKDIVDSFSVKLWFKLRQSSSLWARFMLRKYYQGDNPACVPFRGYISSTWRRLLNVRPRAEPGIRWRIGIGDVSFWDDIWFGEIPLSSQSEVRGIGVPGFLNLFRRGAGILISFALWLSLLSQRLSPLSRLLLGNRILWCGFTVLTVLFC